MLWITDVSFEATAESITWEKTIELPRRNNKIMTIVFFR